VTPELAQAVFYIPPARDEGDAHGLALGLEEGEMSLREEEEVEMRIRRDKAQWPWLWGMVRWGYPPGWVAARGKPRRSLLLSSQSVITSAAEICFCFCFYQIRCRKFDDDSRSCR
jgi:hypothetical protein